MKKSLTSILILVLSFLLTGCNLPLHFYTKMPTATPAATTATTTSASTTAEPDVPLPPEIVTVNKNPAGEPSSNPSKISGIEPNDGGFGISFEVTRSFTRGEVMTLDISLINNTGKTYAWTGSSSVFHPRSVELWCVKEDGRKYKIPIRSLPDTDDIRYNEVKNGESYTRIYVFDIPEDAPAGDYTLTCSFQADPENGGRKDTIIFEGYFRLEE